MERLTKLNGNGEYYFPACWRKCKGNPQDCDHCPEDDKICQKLGEYEDAEESGLMVRLPCKVGSTVWVSPNNGESFHTGKLYGMNENGSYLVFVDDKVRDFVDFPFERKAIYDWFFKIYTREEAEQALKERAGK